MTAAPEDFPKGVFIDGDLVSVDFKEGVIELKFAPHHIPPMRAGRYSLATRQTASSVVMRLNEAEHACDQWKTRALALEDALTRARDRDATLAETPSAAPAVGSQPGPLEAASPNPDRHPRAEMPERGR